MNKKFVYQVGNNKKVKNITVYVSGYTENDTTGMLSPMTVWPFRVAVDINSNVFDFFFLIWSLSRLLFCVGSGFNVAAALEWMITLIYSQKLELTKKVFYGYFVGSEHENDIKNCCLALVSKIQEAAFMYSAFRFQIRV